jgi:hypothetical protein
VEGDGDRERVWGSNLTAGNSGDPGGGGREAGGSDSGGPGGGGRESGGSNFDGTTASDGSDEPRGEESTDDGVNASDIWSGSNNEEGGSGMGIKRALERIAGL